MEAYDASGLENDRSYRFMSDMAYRMNLGKGMSTGQRRYLDNLIDQGVPKPKNESRVKEILAAAEVDGMQNVKTTLHDFAFKVGKGWSLSEKQEKFLANLLVKAETLKVEGRFRPSDEMLMDLENANAVCATKNGWYWNHRPGIAKAYEKVSNWLDWNRRNEVSKELKAKGIPSNVVDDGHFVGEEPLIDQWACDKLLSSVKNQINELHNPKHAVGDMRWSRNPGGPKKLALVSGAPQVMRGEVVYPCLIDGGIIDVSSKDLLKRRG